MPGPSFGLCMANGSVVRSTVTDDRLTISSGRQSFTAGDPTHSLTASHLQLKTLDQFLRST